MGTLDGRVAVITGAGRGMGREHALLFAAEGAAVVVNDNGSERDGTGTDPALAEAVAAEIRDSGGAAIASGHDVTTTEGATALWSEALAAFDAVDVVVNNAGALRDRMIAGMTPEDFDFVVQSHLGGTFRMLNLAARHWRDRSKAGAPVAASVVNVSSTSGLIGAVGQANYGAAKAGIAAMTIIAAEELGRYGVRVNAITPVARTRMTEAVPGLADVVRAPDDPERFDVYHPGNVSPFVAWLATEDCPVTGKVFYVKGGEVRTYEPWHHEPTLARDGRWSVAELGPAMAPYV